MAAQGITAAMLKQSGIYSITNTNNGMRYIGSSSNINSRWYEHRRRLANGKHENAHLLRSWRKHGVETFAFEILELVEPTRLIETEQWWIDAFSFNRLYNVRQIADSCRGIKRSPEVCEAIRKRMKLSGVHPALREGHRVWRPTQVHSAASNEKRRQKMLGLDRGPAFAEKMKAASGGRDPQWIAKMKAGLAQSYTVTSPTGESQEIVNLKTFANDNGLNAGHLYAVAKGRREHHRGWRVVKV